ncbi:hypothetical protein J7K03_00600 [bacterium]|nr:hypothetical protein [bacterium]
MRKKFTRIKTKNLSYSKMFSIIAFIFILSLIGLYILQSSSIVKLSFLIDEYERKIKSLSIENRNMEIALSQKNSLIKPQDYLETLGFEKITKVDYIKVIEGSVAAK